MGDPDEDKKSGGVLTWQLKPSDTSQELPKESQDTGPDQTPSRASVIEHARRFLLEDEVRNAPTDKQISFLEAKGLESHEIKELLGVARNVEASSSNSEPSTPSEAPPKETPSQQPIESPSSPTMTQSTRDVPPIITYPEFLVTPSQPAPLITARRLLGTLYLFGGLSALLYGTNLYLITPMIAALTASRHELAETAQEKLDKLIAKLEGMVSETPQKSFPAAHYHKESDEEDSDSDPTELFHRDIGIQTSLPSSPSPSRPTSPPPATTATETQAGRIAQLSSHITDLNEASTSEGQESSDLSACVGILREYLESLAYVSPSSSYSYGSSGGLYGSGGGGVGAGQKNEQADDEVAKVKAQIRGVKGVLLSARSFPAGNWQGRVR